MVIRKVQLVPFTFITPDLSCWSFRSTSLSSLWHSGHHRAPALWPARWLLIHISHLHFSGLEIPKLRGFSPLSCNNVATSTYRSLYHLIIDCNYFCFGVQIITSNKETMLYNLMWIRGFVWPWRRYALYWVGCLQSWNTRRKVWEMKTIPFGAFSFADVSP